MNVLVEETQVQCSITLLLSPHLVQDIWKQYGLLLKIIPCVLIRDYLIAYMLTFLIALPLSWPCSCDLCSRMAPLEFSWVVLKHLEPEKPLNWSMSELLKVPSPQPQEVVTSWMASISASPLLTEGIQLWGWAYSIGSLVWSLNENVQLNSVNWGTSHPVSQRPALLGQPSH